jgi:hypothetical protein
MLRRYLVLTLLSVLIAGASSWLAQAGGLGNRALQLVHQLERDREGVARLLAEQFTLRSNLADGTRSKSAVLDELRLEWAVNLRREVIDLVEAADVVTVTLREHTDLHRALGHAGDRAVLSLRTAGGKFSSGLIEYQSDRLLSSERYGAFRRWLSDRHADEAARLPERSLRELDPQLAKQLVARAEEWSSDSAARRSSL